MSKVPTLTLARLFEAQDQLIDAYVIYSHLNNHTPSDQLQQKITELEEAVFDKVANSYDQMISLLFTDAEKRRFRILPAETYSAYSSARQDIAEDASNPEPPEKEEIPPQLTAQEILNSLTPDELNEEIQVILQRGTALESVSLADLLQAIKNRKRHEKKRPINQ